MFARIFLTLILSSLHFIGFAQKNFTVLRDLRGEWMTFEDGSYQHLGQMPFTGLTTIYFQLDASARSGEILAVNSSDTYYIFVNGKVRGEFEGTTHMNIDSLLKAEGRTSWVAVHQQRINERDLSTQIVSSERRPVQIEAAPRVKPYSSFRDFVVISGLVIIVLFLAAVRLNPKLAADYLSITGIFTSREADDSQAVARLTGGSNVQFYILCSLLIGYYLFIILFHLPPQYALPIRFQASGFWMMWVQWLKLSAIIFIVLLLKIVIIFTLTRLFDMRGMARFHFFNWIRLLLVALGASTVILFMYFISRGDVPENYVLFLSIVIAVLIGWIVVAFFKLSGKSGHSMFHLFSYLCATEIIPLLITVKVLFQ